MGKHIYLAKANNKLVSHCKCKNKALITFPPQMDCPWCGCGWLFTCIACRKAFTFAKGIETDEPLSDLARRDLANLQGKTPDKKDISQWVAYMRGILADVKPGKEYVYLDGVFVPSDATGIKYIGEHAMHNLDFVPQVKALEDESVIESILTNVDYWQRNALSDDEREELEELQAEMEAKEVGS